MSSTSEPDTVISADAITHYYANRDRRFAAIRNLSIDIHRNEFICLIGPSGKSTFLRIVAGLMSPSEGMISLNGSRIRGPGLDRGVVFQEPALFPWLKVRQNVEFGLRSAGWKKSSAAARAISVLESVGLADSADLYPYQLSGGMQHRVAVARGWSLTDTEVLLMDEPFSAVDAITRVQLQSHLVHTWQTDPRAVLYVTHDIDEAVFLGQRVVVLTPAPARIAAEIPINLNYPRDRESPEFSQLEREITAALDRAMSSGAERHDVDVIAADAGRDDSIHAGRRAAG